MSTKFITALKLALHGKGYDDYLQQVHDLVEEMDEHFSDYRSDPESYKLCLYADKRSLTTQHPLAAVCIFVDGQQKPCFAAPILGNLVKTATQEYAMVNIDDKPVHCDVVDSLYLDQIL